MALLPILEFPDPRLRSRAAPVAAVDARIQQLVDDMFETMYAAPGIGLAASQVDVHERVIVMDLSEDHSDPRVFINPEITVIDETLGTYDEGCLSVPGFYETVERPQIVEVTALDREGTAFTERLDGLMGICLQHEIDHLNGMTIHDRQMITTIVNEQKFGRNEKVMITDGNETKELKWKKAESLVKSGEWEIYVGGPIT